MSDEVANPLPAPQPSRPTKRRWKFRFVMLAAAVVLIAVFWALQPESLDTAVHRAGGIIERPGSSFVQRIWDRIEELLNRAAGSGGPIEHCIIRFGSSSIDDAWILDHLPQLQREDNLHFFAQESRITETGFAALASCSGLYTLEVRNSGANRQCLATLQPSENLRSLVLAGTNLQPEDVVLFGQFPHLNTLGLDGRLITPVGLGHVARRTRINSLTLVDPNDEQVVRACQLTDLSNLQLEGPGVTDASVPGLLNLRSPFFLVFLRTSLTPEGLDRLRGRFPGAQVISYTQAELDQAKRNSN